MPAAPTELNALLDHARGRAVLIVGDLMLDHFLIGRVDRISPEAPVPVVQFDHESFRLGGAANVAHNVAALGGSVEIAGVVGNDAEGTRLLADLRRVGIGTAGVTVFGYCRKVVGTISDTTGTGSIAANAARSAV